MESDSATDGSELVLVFDMDGTLFDTEEVKMASFRDAFRPLCGGDEQALQAVHAFNAANRGVPRSAKLSSVLTMIGAPQSGADEVARRYAALLAERLPLCEPLPGLVEFLRAVPAIRYVASSAPPAEITGNLSRTGLDTAFADSYGHPWSKEQALQDVARRHPAARLVFFGDAPADLSAARTTGTTFVAINPNPQLAGYTGERFPDFPDFPDFQDAAAIAATCAGTG